MNIDIVDETAEPQETDESCHPIVDVVIEIPRWSFLKRGSTGSIDFISPLPCPFNYGSVPDRLGLEGDLLDAVVLGPRLATGTHLRVPARGAVGLAERGLYDDKLICSEQPVTGAARRQVLVFFHTYILAKRLLNMMRGLSTDGHCTGWGDAVAALARSGLRDATWKGPVIPF